MPKAVPGWQKLLDDCDAVEAMFKRKTFKGEFQMTSWGRHSGERDHAPEERNFCGTAACMAGWLSIAGKHEFRGKFLKRTGELVTGEPGKRRKYYTFADMARQVYGMDAYQSQNLFNSGMDMSLAQKLKQARHIAWHIKASRVAL